MNPSAIHLYPITLDAPEHSLAAAGALLSEDEAARAARFVHLPSRRRYTLARAALRTVLAGWLGARPTGLRFAYSATGKPSLTPACGLEFNLSHSGDLAVCAVARGLELGVDVEIPRPVPDLEDLARRFFSPAEAGQLMALPPGARLAAFFRCWTRKEAFLKATGEGLSRALASFQVAFAEDAPARLLALSDGSAQAWALAAFTPAPGAEAAVCHRAPSRPLALYAPVTAEALLLGEAAWSAQTTAAE